MTCGRPAAAAAAAAVGAVLLALLLTVPVRVQAQLQGLVTPAEQAKTRDQLLAFKASFSNGAQRLSNWAGNNVCAWQGVVCDSAGRVAEQ